MPLRVLSIPEYPDAGSSAVAPVTCMGSGNSKEQVQTSVKLSFYIGIFQRD